MTKATPRSQLTGVMLTFVVAAAPAANVAAQDDPSGVAQGCIRPTSIDRTRILDDRNILFFMRDDVVYHNVLPNTCPQLRSEGRFAYDRAGNRLCLESSITVIVERGIGQFVPGPVCRLGMFLPVTEDEVEDLLAFSKKGKRNSKGSSDRGPIEAEPVELPPKAEEPTTPAPATPESAPSEAPRSDAATAPGPTERPP